MHDTDRVDGVTANHREIETRICCAYAAWHDLLFSTNPLAHLAFQFYVAKPSHWLRGSFTMSEVAHLGATQPVHLRDRVDRRDCAPQTARPGTPAAIAIGLADQFSALDLFERVATIRSTPFPPWSIGGFC